MGRFRSKTPLRLLLRSRTILLFRHAHVQLRLQGIQGYNHSISQGCSSSRRIHHMGLLQYVFYHLLCHLSPIASIFSSDLTALLPALTTDHDVVRHATRYGIPDAVQKGGLSFASFCREYLKSGGTKPECKFEQGLQRARAATLMMLALPGSAYLYQYVLSTRLS